MLMKYIPKKDIEKAYKPSGETGKEGTVGLVLDYCDECAEAVHELLASQVGISKNLIQSHVKSFLPNRYGLGKYLGVSQSVISTWEANYPEFANVLEFMDTVSTETLINNSLIGVFKEGVSKKLLEKQGGINEDYKSPSVDNKSINYYFTYPHDKAELDNPNNETNEPVSSSNNTLDILRDINE